MESENKAEQQFDYDVCLSFAGEDRAYVSQTADILRSIGVRVFYDEYEEAELWGKDLYAHLHEVYSRFARYCVLFISKHYSEKLWTNHERKAAHSTSHCLFFILSVFCCASLLGAVDTEKRREAIRQKLLEKRDTKGDGKLDAVESLPPKSRDSTPCNSDGKGNDGHILV